MELLNTETLQTNKIQPKLIKTDVTCLKVFDRYILAGIGNVLFVYSKLTYKLIQRILIFEAQPIYGLDILKGNILFYGGLHLKLAQIQCFEKELTDIKSLKHNDWILHSKWINNKLAVITMHNSLTIFDKHLNKELEISCEEKCILYSAQLCFNNFSELVIICGTVFSEILIWKPSKNQKVIKRLKGHKGVIFSLRFNPDKNLICSTSDDRTAILWKIKGNLHDLEDSNEIVRLMQLSNHTSRIFNCCISNQYFATAGEDSLVNIFDFEGNLVKKIDNNQGSIWSIESADDLVLFGGSDSSVSAISLHESNSESVLKLPEAQNPKHVAFLSENILISFTEQGLLYSYHIFEERYNLINEHKDLITYSLLEVSSCRTKFALAGFLGQIYLYSFKNNPIFLGQIQAEKSRIFSFHWLNCSSFLICQREGLLSLYYSRNEFKSFKKLNRFQLPLSKERWTNCAVLNKSKRQLIVGDRKGNIHLFNLNETQPIQTLKKMHSHLGVTNLYCFQNSLLSLGRNNIIKQYNYNNNLLNVNVSDKLPFSWLSRIIDPNTLIGFNGNNLILFDLNNKRILFEKYCGGGHRSWDLINTNFILFAFIKDKTIHLNKIGNIYPITLEKGVLGREINSLQVVKLTNTAIIISGGENTMFNVSLLRGNELNCIFSLKSHLSSIRSIIVLSRNDSEINIISAGGRAQLVSWKLSFETENGQVNVQCKETDSFYDENNIDSENRIMDLTSIRLEKSLVLAACSDGFIKSFMLSDHNQFKHVKDFWYQRKCILKIANFNIFNQNVIISMATDGKVVFWTLKEFDLNCIKSFDIHQSGINSYSFVILENLLVLLTGGDDNAICLSLFKVFENNGGIDFEKLDMFIETGLHCAQITGVDLKQDTFITGSIDQRVCFFKWKIDNSKLQVEFDYVYNTAITDLQGVVVDGSDIFLYGKGFEYLTLENK